MLIQRELSSRFSNLVIKAIFSNRSLFFELHNARKFHAIIHNWRKPNHNYTKVIYSKFHVTKSCLIKQKNELAPREHFFRMIKKKDKETFLKILESYNTADPIKRGHIEFIYSALKYMDDYGVDGDLQIYKKIMDIFPKGRMIPKNLVQAEFFHFARHQDCAITTLDKMEHSGVCPDKEMADIILASFGRSSHVFKKYSRMMYWMPKLKNINPYMLPNPLPDDIRELAKLALKKMSVDKRTKIEEYDAEQLEDSVDKTWIMSAQSPVQQKLIEEHSEEKAIYVEGPSLVWLRKVTMSYYVLCSDPKVYPVVEEDEDDVSKLSLYMFGEPKPKSLVAAPKSVHEQEDATILGMCCTGTSSKDSVLSWIRFLHKTNPKLDRIPVLFKIRSSPSSLVSVNTDKESSTDAKAEELPNSPDSQL